MGVPQFIACSYKPQLGGNSPPVESVDSGVTVVFRPKATALLVALTLALSACGSTTAEPQLAPAGGETAGSIFPAVDVIKLDGEETVDFASQMDGGDQAILVWFWAPH